MLVLVVLFFVSIALPIAVGLLAHRRQWSVAGGPTAWGRGAAQRYGRWPAAIGIAVVGCVVTFVVGLAMGSAAKAMQASVDKPIFRWVQARVHDGSKFSKMNLKLTTMGNTGTVEIVAMFALVLLGVAYRRRWYVPVGVILAMFVVERYEQNWLARIVNRGHPPTTLGTYPSGGVGRILADIGIILFLSMLLIPGLSRGWKAGLWTGLAAAASLEAFTRVYTSKHWFTDAVFALPFGAMLIITGVASVSALTAGDHAEPDSRHAVGSAAHV